MIIDNLKRVVEKNTGANPLYLRNLLKEQLQFYTLNFIYGSSWGENLLFKGGSCLRMFFDLPRLSEDLDLDIVNPKTFVSKDFLTDLEKYFGQTLQYKKLEVSLSGKKNILKLKFPLLDTLGLAKEERTKTLFLRIDLSTALGKSYKTELSLKSTHDFSFLVKRYSLPDLFSGKIAAILGRTVMEAGKTVPRIKGRDYFDLAWLMEKKITPNFAYLAEITGIKNQKQLKTKLEEKVDNLDLAVLRQDLLPLFREKNFVDKFCKNYKNIFNILVENWGTHR